MLKNEFSVGELNEYVNQLLTNNEILSNVTVKGEISNYINHSSGHRYFSLKDKEGAIACAMFSFSGKSLKFEPKNGDKVVVTGYVGVYKKDGRYQLYVKTMAMEGIGNLHEKFEKLKAQLLKEGLFDKEHKKTMPIIKRKIGIVTSPTGAAVQDMLNIIFRRYPNSDVVIYPAKVQGEDAYLSIIEGIAYFNNEENIDVVIVGRGGGSYEDLWAFNEEQLARAIFESNKPIISAVGHETDFTIADFVADFRAPTPSAAAELCVPVKQEIKKYIEDKVSSLDHSITNCVNQKRSQIDILKNKILRFNPIFNIDQQRQSIDNLRQKLDNSINNILISKNSQLKIYSEKLETLNPNGVLKRGYSIIKNSQGKAIESKKKVKTNDNISIVFYDGNVDAIVK